MPERQPKPGRRQKHFVTIGLRRIRHEGETRHTGRGQNDSRKDGKKFPSRLARAGSNARKIAKIRRTGQYQNHG